MSLLKYKRYLVSIYLMLFLNNICLAEEAKNNVSLLSAAHANYLVFAVPSQFDRLDPTLSMNAQTKNALQLIFEPLIRLNDKQEIESALAKDWLVNTNKNLIVMHIQENHLFSDGTKLTANDVVNSILRMCRATSESISDLHGLVGCEPSNKNNTVPQVKALDNSHVELKINVSPSLFLFQLTSPRVVITKERYKGLIGSGPYQLESGTSDHLLLKRNPLYWNFRSVENKGLILFRLEEKQLNSWIAKNNLDGTIMYSISGIMKFDNKNYKLTNEPPMTTEILVFNNQRFPFNKKIVRQAIISDIYNRNNISRCMSGVYRAYGVIPRGIGGSIANMLPQTMPDVHPEEVFNEVPELKNHFFSVTIHRHSALKNDCEDNELVAAAKKYHINATFKYHEDYSSLWPLYLNHHLDGFVEFFDVKSREAYSVFQVFMTNSPENYSNINDKKLDFMIAQALMAASSHERFQQYKKINQYLQSEGYIDPYYYIGHSNILNKCLVGLTDSFYFNPYQYLPNVYRKPSCVN